jgi:hypothetical protein
MLNGIIGIYSNLESVIKVNFEAEKEEQEYEKNEDALKSTLHSGWFI